MPIISKETWDKFTQEEKEKILQLNEKLVSLRDESGDRYHYFKGSIDNLKAIFPKETLQPQPLTYEDVARELYNNSAGTFGIPERDFSKKSDVKPWDYFGVYSKEAQQKVIAIIKLLNVAKFLNGDWKPDWEDGNEIKYGIGIYNGKIEVEPTAIYQTSFVYFRTEELAKQAVAILGEDTVRLALTTEY